MNIRNDTLWRLPRVASFMGVSTRTIMREVERGAFPAPLKLPAGSSVRNAWRASVVVAHAEAALAKAEAEQRQAAQP